MINEYLEKMAHEISDENDLNIRKHLINVYRYSWISNEDDLNLHEYLVFLSRWVLLSRSLSASLIL